MYGSVYEALPKWLANYPNWEEAVQLHSTQNTADHFCLRPMSMEQVSRRTDLNGNSLVGYQYKFALTWQMPGTGDETENARRLLDFQSWIYEQNECRSIPRLGDVYGWEKIHTEKGGYTPDGQFVTYNVSLVVNLAKEYPPRV